MRKILLVVPDLNYRGHARQASLLANALPRDEFSVEILSLDSSGPFAEPLRAAGVAVEAFKRGNALNVKDWFDLRRRLTVDPPDVVHAFGTASLRAIGFAGFGISHRLPPIVFNDSLTGSRAERAGWLSRRLSSRVGAIVAANEPERARMIALGFAADRLHVVRPGVPLPTVQRANRDFRPSFGIPEEARLILSIGEMRRLDRMHAVYWGFDILHYVHPSLHAIVVGDGPFRSRTETDARSSMFDDYRIHFLGARADAATLLPCADMIWVVPRCRGGTYAVLEGMAAGRPVVASALPHLSAIIADGETGQLIPPHDPPALARISHKLLQDGNLCRRLGAAARATIETSFRVDTMAQRFAEIYESSTRVR